MIASVCLVHGFVHRMGIGHWNWFPISVSTTTIFITVTTFCHHDHRLLAALLSSSPFTATANWGSIFLLNLCNSSQNRIIIQFLPFVFCFIQR